MKKEALPQTLYNRNYSTKTIRIGVTLPITIIRQESLFGIQELYEIELTQRYQAIISAIDLDKIYHELNKKPRLGAPVELNYMSKHKGNLYASMIITLFIRYIDRISSLLKVYFLHNIFFCSIHTQFAQFQESRLCRVFFQA